MVDNKFKIWDEENKEMIGPFNLRSAINNWEYITGRLAFEKHYRLIWFTRLKDKNGKERFENDIIKGKYTKKTYDALVFQKGEFIAIQQMCGLKIINEKIESEDNDFVRYGGSVEYFNEEIIGNIFENPELIKI